MMIQGTRAFSGDQWALILGGSSGMGLATAKKLASVGMSVCIVHRDRRGATEKIEEEFQRIRAIGESKFGSGFVSWNGDALSPEGQEEALKLLRSRLGETGGVRLLLHSIAWGNLKPIAPANLEPGAFSDHLLLKEEDFARTIYGMGVSLLSWVQRLVQHGLFCRDARVLGLTSEGNSVAWPGYAAVSAAKATLESLVRSIATEYARFGIRCNVVQAGVTDTPALRAIPGAEAMKRSAEVRNPFGRLTTPEDIADVISLLCKDEAAWINGALIRADGGEHIASG